MQLLLDGDGYPALDYDLATLRFRDATTGHPETVYTKVPLHPDCMSAVARPRALFVDERVLTRLGALHARPCEVGGWLLGYWSDDRRSLFVTQLTPPTVGRPWRVTISGDGHYHYFDQAWDASDGDVTFLGDWHTHPGQPATPSRRDRVALLKLATEPDYGTPRPLIAIARTRRWRWRWQAPLSEVRFYLGDEAGETVELVPRVSNTLPDSAARVPNWPWSRS